jgi:hypothetical protein
MWVSIVVTLTLVGCIPVLLLARHRFHRNQTLSELASRRLEWTSKHPIEVVSTADRKNLADTFSREKIVRIDQFLSQDFLQFLRSEAEENLFRMVPSYIPTHKKGHTLSYENVQRYAHGCLGFYHSPEIMKWVSDIVGMKVEPTPDCDQSSLSLLCYREAGDHINWHYDHNFYRGRHFTVLLSLANESAVGGLSQSSLMRRLPSGDETVNTKSNTLVIFEGSEVLHRASPTAEGDVRIMLSMTYCSDPRTGWLREFARRVKDTAFFGVRALWD